jgi:hypothetical protein
MDQNQFLKAMNTHLGSLGCPLWQDKMDIINRMTADINIPDAEVLSHIKSTGILSIPEYLRVCLMYAVFYNRLELVNKLSYTKITTTPVCRYHDPQNNRTCNRQGCQFSHPVNETMQVNPETVMATQSSDKICRYHDPLNGKECKRQGCHFQHPEPNITTQIPINRISINETQPSVPVRGLQTVCRFNVQCTTPRCYFAHGSTLAPSTKVQMCANTSNCNNIRCDLGHASPAAK